jgi:hypothetical protein
MKTISTKLDDETVKVLEEKAQQQNMTVSEYLRQEISPLIEGTKPLSLEQCLAKLESCLSRLHFCVKPLQELAFDLQKLDVAFSLGLVEKEKPVEQSQVEPETVTAPS